MLELAKDEQILNSGYLQESDKTQQQESAKGGESGISPHLQEYRQRMQKFHDLITEEHLEEVRERLQQQGIYYRPEKPFEKGLEVQFKGGSVNREVMIFLAKWGNFAMKIKVLNTDRPPSAIHRGNCDAGTFGLIYKGIFRTQRVAVKCIEFKGPKHRRKIIKEYFLAKIASALEVGPKIELVFGFDVLMSEGCGNFVMQLCDHPSSKGFQPSDLFRGLSLMHRLNFIHLDIKPENIMFSPAFKKLVLIDFGLSSLIGDKIGELTFTDFTGNVNYCSKEMLKCFCDQKKMDVDLYYNDLVAMEGSLSHITQQLLPKEQQQENEEDSYIRLSSEQQLEYFEYFSVVLSKYFLFKDQIDELQEFQAKLSKAERELNREELMRFLLELFPTRSFHSLFKKYSSDKESETVDYKKIKIVSEMSQYTLCPIQIFVDDQKLSLFTQYCSEIQSVGDDQDDEDREKSRLRAVRELVTTPALASSVPFLDYVLNYLFFMSYVNNRCGVDATAREAAAKVYQELFMVLSPPLKGRKLVEATILHLLNKTLGSGSKTKDPEKFTLFVFRVHDFLVVLDQGSAQEYLSIVNKLLESLPSFLKQTFLSRISFSALLHMFRITKKGQMSRISFRLKIFRWIKLKMSAMASEDNILQLSEIMWRKKKEQLFSDSFMEEFGFETIQYLRRSAEAQTQKEIQITIFEIVTRIMNVDSYPKWTYLVLLIFQMGIHNLQSNNLCKNILRSIKESIADEEIFDEFSFDFQLSIQEELKQSYSLPINYKFLDEVEAYLNKVEAEDLFFFNSIIFALIDHIRLISLHQKSEKNLMEYVLQKLTFIEKIFGSNLQFLNQQMTHENCYSLENHIHLQHVFIMNLYTLSKIFLPSRQHLVSQILHSNLQNASKCLECERKVSLLTQISNIQMRLTLFCTFKEKMEHQLLLFKEINFLSERISEHNTYDNVELDVLQKGLFIGALVCCLDLQREMKYKGLLGYYCFAKNFNLMSIYFSCFVDNNFPIFYTLNLLNKRSPAQCAEFLVRLATVPEKSFSKVDLETFRYYTLNFFADFQDQQILTFFQLVNKFNSESGIATDFVIALFAIFFYLCKSEKLEGKFCSAVEKRIARIHFRFQRELTLFLLVKVTKRLEYRKGKSKREERKWRFCNNFLVREMAVLEQSICSPKKDSKNKMRRFLLSKVQKMGRGDPKLISVKFLLKK